MPLLASAHRSCRFELTYHPGLYAEGSPLMARRWAGPPRRDLDSAHVCVPLKRTTCLDLEVSVHYRRRHPGWRYIQDGDACRAHSLQRLGARRDELLGGRTRVERLLIMGSRNRRLVQRIVAQRDDDDEVASRAARDMRNERPRGADDDHVGEKDDERASPLASGQ